MKRLLLEDELECASQNYKSRLYATGRTEKLIIWMTPEMKKELAQRINYFFNTTFTAEGAHEALKLFLKVTNEQSN